MKFVYGGSFNPPTLAHLEIMMKIHHFFKDSKIVILPVGNHYTWKTNLVPFNDRLKMISLLIEEKDYISVSDIENTLDYKGTYDSLKRLKEENEDLYFVLGTDHMDSMDKWLNIDLLIKEFKFLVIKRTNYETNFDFLIKNKADFKVLEFDSEISSSKIRSNIEENKKYLSSKVYKYIIENNLYEGLSND